MKCIQILLYISVQVKPLHCVTTVLSNEIHIVWSVEGTNNFLMIAMKLGELFLFYLLCKKRWKLQNGPQF